MKTLLLIVNSILFMSQSTLANDSTHKGQRRIENCSDSLEGETICTAKIINRKLNKIIKKLDTDTRNAAVAESVISLSFFDDTSCKKRQGSSALFEGTGDLKTVKTLCGNLLNTLTFDSVTKIKSVRVNGACSKLDNNYNNFSYGDLMSTCVHRVYKK
jgi:hypothetical protein